MDKNELWHAFRQPLILVLMVIIIWVMIELRAILVAVVFALTLASAISPIAERCEEKAKMPRALTVMLIYILVGLLYVFLAAALYPTIREQAVSLYKQLPQYAAGLMDVYARFKELLGENASAISVSSDDVRSFVSRLSNNALHFTQDAVSMIVSGILVLFLTAYFVIEAKHIWPKLLEWLPQDRRERMAKIIRPLENRLGGYIRGQLLVSLAVATFLTVGMYLIRVDHALLLGSLAGLFNLIPFVGSMLTCVLAVIVAFNQSVFTGVACLLLFAVEQWVESNFIVPHLLGKQVELHPLVVLFSILAGATLLGLPGALIAVPLATAGMFLAEEFYLRPMHEQEGRMN